MEGTGGFRLNNLSVEYWIIYKIVMCWIHLVKSKDPITFDRALCLYTILTRVSINYATVIIALMRQVPHSGMTTFLPFGVFDHPNSRALRSAHCRDEYTSGKRDPHPQILLGESGSCAREPVVSVPPLVDRPTRQRAARAHPSEGATSS
jgi:hypothetical protein